MIKAHEIEWTEEQVSCFWSYYGDKTHAYFAESYGAEIVRRTSEYLTHDAICLDFGCGSGGLSSALLDSDYKVIASDMSLKSVQAVSARFASRTKFIGAFSADEIMRAELPLADVVYSVETIEHVTEPNIRDYFETIRKLVKPSGVVIFSTPNDEDIEAAKVFCPESGAIYHPMQHVRSFDNTRLGSFLTQYGFVTKSVFATDLGLNWRHSTKRWIADKAKRILRMGVPYPHLVAVASPQYTTLAGR